jgi:GDP-D-mannose 3',5'-epimerase
MNVTVVLGAGGFIGHHLVNRLKNEGAYVIGVDLKHPAFEESKADTFIIGDLRDFSFVEKVIPENIDELYQLAADMGGAGYIFSGENDANIMHNSVSINLNVAKLAIQKKVKTLFYASSACVYPFQNQANPNKPNCEEKSAYPANPDSEYGWEKLFSERLYLNYHRNYKLDVKIARFHNVYGTLSNWNDGKEKAPAAICRKVIESKENEPIEIWGDGKQTRSFLFIDDCIEGILMLTRSNKIGPYNIGSEELISISDLVKLVLRLSNKDRNIVSVAGPVGVRGRNSVNNLIVSDIGWNSKISLKQGISILYEWIQKQINSDIYPISYDNEI